MSINVSLYEASLITMIDDFLSEKIDIDTFCCDLTGLWIAFRDEHSKIRESWDHRYDVEVQEDFLQGRIIADEFRKKYNELFNLTEFEDFTKTIDPLHSLCSCYDPIPESE
jgi:hypothetical protein